MGGEKWHKLNDDVRGLSTTNVEDHSHELVRDKPLDLESITRFTQIRTL